MFGNILPNSYQQHAVGKDFGMRFFITMQNIKEKIITILLIVRCKKIMQKYRKNTINNIENKIYKKLNFIKKLSQHHKFSR